jgi:hypothetical protein
MKNSIEKIKEKYNPKSKHPYGCFDFYAFNYLPSRFCLAAFFEAFAAISITVLPLYCPVTLEALCLK